MEREDHPIPPLLDADVIHHADGALFHAGVAAEGRKVLLAQQIRRRAAHPLHIRLVVQQRHIFPVEHRLHRAHMAGVAVGLAQRVVPGVEPGRGLLYLPDGDGVRQVAVHVVPDLLRRQRRVQHHVGGHGAGVYPGIRAACADDVHRRAL